MKGKTKEQPVSELAELRQRIADLEASETELKRAEEELGESLKREQFLGDIIRNASVAVGIGYPDGRLGENNAAFQELTGYSDEELRAIDWNTVLTPPEWEELETARLQELHRTKKPVLYEKEYIRKDGSRVPIELLVHPKLDSAGDIERYFAFVTDITERKRAEDALAQRVQELETFNRLAVGRELRMVELKRQVNELAEQLGKEPPYDLSLLE